MKSYLANVAEGLQTEGLVDVSSAGDVADGASLSYKQTIREKVHQE